MNILISGGTGFIGQRFVQKLAEEKCHAYVLTRYPKQYRDSEFVSYISYQYPLRRLPTIHAVVNLAGESLFGYWTKAKKEKIISSRLDATERLIQVMMQMDPKPSVFVSGSAIGFYGTAEDTTFTEQTIQPGNDFLASVAVKWEKAAQTAEDLGIRTVYTRFGVVLDRENGALPFMALPIQLFLGGRIGKGNQWISWIHIDDCINLLWHIIQDQTVKGPINFTAPHPATNKNFTKTLAKVLKRPTMVNTPATMIQLVLGEMHQLVTSGQFVYPKKALDCEFTFKYKYLEDALRAIYR